MAIRSKSFEDMIREIIISLRTGEPKRPAFTLLVGSGFSYPIIPTPTQMLKGDIAWWRYSKDRKITDPFCSRAEGVSGGKATEEQIADFEREMWKPIHARALTSKETAFGLTPDGLPDLTTPNSVGLAYQAVMADGLLNNKMRRQYLRDAIQRSHPKVNGAHIFLAGILEAQESWDWGAPFCRTIFTTNFDPLLQRSLQLVNKLYYMTDRPDVLEPPDDDQSEAIHLVYTHGSVHRYDLLNTEDEIKHAREKNAPTLIDYFRRHGVIVMGYSGWADTTMDALSSCASFDSNLYWCDIHSAADAQTRLRPEVLKVLEAQEKHAYYVPIPGADEAMRLLHNSLSLGPVPKFILAPVDTMIAQLKSIEVPSDPVAAANPDTLSTSLKNLLDGTMRRLDVAKSAFDNPAIVQAPSSKGQEEVAQALIAQLMSDAYVAYAQGKRDHVIALLSTVITTPGVPAQDRARALYNRAVTLGESGNIEGAIADYTVVIEMRDISANYKATALNNRGVAWTNNNETEKAIADYSNVIDMPEAPADQKAMALFNRALARAKTDDAMNDYEAIIDMADAPAETKAMALFNRAIAWSKNGETTKEAADYTAVIDMPNAPSDVKAKALNNRSLTWATNQETQAIADYTSVIDMLNAPSKQKADAFVGRGWKLFTLLDDAASMINDSREAIELDESNHTARANLALGLLLSGEARSAVVEYEALLSKASGAGVIQSAIDDLETALRKRPETPEAAKILDLLRSAIPANGDASGFATT